MSINLQIRNFRKIAAAELVDHGKVSVVLGYNEAGKSSLAGAIEFAVTGSAFGLKGKEVAHLVREGQTRLKVELKCGRIDLSRTTSSGAAIKDVAAMFGLDSAALPLLLNPTFCAQSGGKAMAAFLALREAKPLDLALLFADKPELCECLKEVAASSKGIEPKWLQVAAEALRAQSPIPAKPSNPTSDRESGDANDLEGLGATFGKIEKLETDIAVCDKLISYYNALDVYSKNAKEITSDALGERRPALHECSNLDSNGIRNAASIIEKAGFAEESKKLVAAADMLDKKLTVARKKLADNPAPAELKKAPVLSPETKDALSRLKHQTLEGVQGHLSMLRNDAEAIRETLPKGIENRHELNNAIAEKLRIQAAWNAYDDALQNYNASVLHTEERWSAFNAISKDIANEIALRRKSAADSFLDSVSKYAAPILNGRTLTLSQDNELCLDGLPCDLLSGSTKWRLLAAVMAAIAKAAGSPLLILDGMDILDVPNRIELTKFIMEQLGNDFEHIILLSTLRGSEEEEEPFQMDGLTKWILSNGQLRGLF